MKLRGDVLKLKGEHEKAISVYEELVRSIPSDNVIDEALRIRQEVSIFIGKVYIEQKKFQMAESYFRKILSDVTQSGVSAGDIGKVYLNLGTCLSHFKKWEEAQWYFLHGCTAYFDDPEVHRGSLLNVIICLDHMVEEGKDEEKKKQYIASLKEYYRQLTNYYGSSKDRIEAQKVYKKYK